MIALHVLFLFVLPGALALAVGQRAARARPPIDASRALFLATWSSILLTTGITHALASVNLFTPRRLFGTIAACVVVMMIIAVRTRAPFLRWRPSRRSMLVVPILVGLGFLYLPPSEFIYGSADEGIYLNTAVWITKSGGISFEDPLLSALPESSRLLHASSYLRGFYFDDVATRSTIVPHGFHFFPAFLAVLYAIGGLDLALAGPGILMLLSIWAVFLIAARFASAWWATLGTIAVGVSPWAIYFARITFAETMSASLFLAAAALISTSSAPRVQRAEPCGARLLGFFIAGNCLGAVHLIKIDFFLLPAVVLVATFACWGKRLDRRTAVLAIGYVLVLIAAAGQWLTTHRVYFAGQVRDAMAKLPSLELPLADRLSAASAIVLLLFVGLTGLAVLLFPLRHRILRVGENEWVRRTFLAGAILAAATLLVAWFLPTGDPNHVSWPREQRIAETIQNLARYLTLPGMLAGTVGVIIWAGRVSARPLAPIFLMFFVQTLIALSLAGSVDWGLKPIAGGRRFLNLTFPLLTLAAILPWSWSTRRAVRLAGIAIGLYIVVAHAITARPFVDDRPWSNGRAVLARLVEAAPADVVWLVSHRDEATKSLLVPLRFLADQPTFVFHDHDTPESFNRLLDDLVNQRKTPVLLCSEGYEDINDRPPLGEDVGFPILRGSYAGAGSPRWSLRLDTARGVQVPMRILRSHFDRLPTGDDFMDWKPVFLLAPCW